MRIAIVGPTHPIKGGVAQHTTVLAQRLARAGHAVQIVSWARQYPDRLYPGRQTVEHAEFAPFEPTSRTLSWNRPDTWLRTARRLRDADLVAFAHVTPLQAPAYRAMTAALRGGRARSVVICHNVLPHERRRADEVLVAALLRSADRVIVHSGAEAETARLLTGKPVQAVTMAPHMPDGFARRAPAAGEHRRLIFFGLVRPYKGLDILLRALAQGPADVRLRVAGEFWGGAGATERLCRELGIAARVEVRDGYVASDAVPCLFANVDALVLPYRTATGSQAVWTGFEFGVPVIATSAGHLADDIRDGVDGLVAEPGSVDSLAEALRRFYQPGVPERMRAEVRPVDVEPYWDRYLQVLLDGQPAGPPPRSQARVRKPQLAYSQVQAKMLDEEHRRTKARKILSVLHRFLGSGTLAGRTALDIGCSAGFIADELARDGANTLGVDIDVPGLRTASARSGDRVQLVCASGDALPLSDESVDVVVFNHIYEHVVDPDAVVSEIHRVLRPSGVAYFGLGNKFQLIEPHYRLPFLSWLPQQAADAYVRRLGRAEEYYETYRSRAGLVTMLRGFHVWDYTVPVIVRPDVYGSGDQVKGGLNRLPRPVLRAAMPVVPTFIWVATKGARRPAAVDAELVHLDLSGSAR